MFAVNYCKMEQYIMSLSNLKRQQLFLKIQHLTIVCYEIYFIFNMSSSLKCRLDFTSKFDTDTLLLAYVLPCVCAFQIGINLAILHLKSIYSKSNFITKPSLLSYLKQCHYLSISHMTFYNTFVVYEFK